MTAREKYIEVLSKTAKTVKEFNVDAPIRISLECVEDILELLKEQGKQKFFVDEFGKITPLPVKEKETVKPKTDSIRRFRCGACDETIGRGQHYCGNCGREVDWNA